MTPLPDSPADSRRLVYALLIALAAGVAGGRILSAERLYEPSVHAADGAKGIPRPAWPRSRPDPWPTFSSNDRSRWALVRALVDEGTFVIGRRDRAVVLASGPAMLAARDPLQAIALFQAGYLARIGSDRGIIFEDGFQSVDKVLHPTRLEFYSTKPPLLAVLAAGEYGVLKKLFGWSIVEQRWEVIRTILFTFNVVPLVLYLALLAWLAERFGGSDWAKFYIIAAGGFATLVNPFLVTFNNHTIAATGVTVALYARGAHYIGGWAVDVRAGWGRGRLHRVQRTAGRVAGGGTRRVSAREGAGTDAAVLCARGAAAGGGDAGRELYPVGTGAAGLRGVRRPLVRV